MQAAAAIEAMANRRGGAAGISIPRSSAVFRMPSLSSAGAGSADGPLVAKARAEQARDSKSLVVVVTRDRGLADRARVERVKTVLIYGQATASEIERGLAEHDSILDIDL